MRYYVIETPELGWIPPFIRAEFAGIPDEPPELAVESGQCLLGLTSEALTREELEATEEGRAALAAWLAGDDSNWESESRTGIMLAEMEDRAAGLYD